MSDSNLTAEELEPRVAELKEQLAALDVECERAGAVMVEAEARRGGCYHTLATLEKTHRERLAERARAQATAATREKTAALLEVDAARARLNAERDQLEKDRADFDALKKKKKSKAKK